MKTRFTLMLPGLIGLFVSTAALAHGSGHGDVYVGNGLSGGISVWADSYGHGGYAGTLSYGRQFFYPPAVYHGYSHGPRCSHRHRHGYDNWAYERAYRRGHRHGSRHGHPVRHGGRNHH